MAKTLALSIGTIVTVAILVGVVMLFRSESPSPPATPKPLKAGAAGGAQASGPSPANEVDPVLAAQVDEMERRMNELLARREEATRNNAALQKEIKGIRTEQSLTSTAPGFVSMLAQKAGGMTDAQRAPVTAMWIRWHMEDQVGEPWRTEDEPQIRHRLLDREAELRALLTPDQQTTLAGLAGSRIKMTWERAAMELANDLGYPVVAVTRQELTRSVEKVLSLIGQAPPAPSSTMILSGAYGVDSTSLKRLATERLMPKLAAEDVPRLTVLSAEQARGGIAGSWHYDLQ